MRAFWRIVASATCGVAILLIAGLSCSSPTSEQEEKAAHQETESLTLLRKTAKRGDAAAQYNLGIMYHEGTEVPKDSAQAIRWLRKAADQGHAESQFSLGFMYEMGIGVPQDYAEGIRWYRKAADQGEAKSQFQLGAMYLNGTGVPKDLTEASRWYRKAADQGEAYAQLFLGLMYENGTGVPQDYVEAHMWLNLGASGPSGDDQKKSASARDGVAKKMTSQQIAEAQRRAREWKPKSVEDKGRRPMK